MKAMILAAGLGTRLRPWTLEHPKALVPVGGVPMLERVVEGVKKQGFDEIVINIHHFGEQIIDYLRSHDFGVRVKVSDERASLLDTGGGILAAGNLFFTENDEAFLVHNVDILSNADLSALMSFHNVSGNDLTLLTSLRESSRKLAFDAEGNLKGWHNLTSDEYRPHNFKPGNTDHEAAFSGIYVVGRKAWDEMRRYSDSISSKAFPVMDFFLANTDRLKIGEFRVSSLRLIDIGKPASLKQADNEFFS